MMNFRKIAAASKGRLLLRYFTEDTPEPSHPPPVDDAGRQLEEGGRRIPISGLRQRAVLAGLLLRANEIVPSEQLLYPGRAAPAQHLLELLSFVPRQDRDDVCDLDGG